MVNKEPTLLVRLVVYPVIAGFFLLGCVIIAFLAMGYNFKYVNGKIVTEKTGSIIVASRPGDATVFVDGKEHDRKTPLFTFFSITVDRLRPGSHTVKVEKEGYETWEDSVYVKPGLVSWLNYILFLPKEKTFYDYKFGQIESLISSPDINHQFVLSRNVVTGTVTIFDISSQNKEKENIYETKALTTEVYKLLTASKNNDRLLVSKTLANKTSYLVIETKQNGRIFALPQLSPAEVYFNPRDHRELVYLEKGTLSRLEYETGKITQAEKDVLDLSFDIEDIFYVKNTEGNYGLWKVQDKPLNIIKTLPVSDAYQVDYLEEERAYAVLPKKQKDLLLFEPDSGNYVLKKIAGEVDYFKASPKSKYLAYKAGKNIFSFEVEKSKTFSAIKDADVTNIGWAEDESNIFYILQNSLKMVNYNGKYNKEIASGVSALTLVSKNYNVYFVKTEPKDLSVFSFNF